MKAFDLFKSGADGRVRRGRLEKTETQKSNQSVLHSNIKLFCNCFQGKDITEMDVKAIFRLVDVDKSGHISRTVIITDLYLYIWYNMLLFKMFAF